MAAPAGNQFWKLRSKHGRDKLFASPELLWEAACEYFEWCEDNPLMEVDYKGKDVEKVEIPKMRAFTLKGLCIYLECTSSYFRAFKSTLKPEDEDFLTVITRVEEVIYTQKFTGAAAGFLNANLISRDLGLADKSVLVGNNDADLFSDKSTEELTAILKEFTTKLGDGK